MNSVNQWFYRGLTAAIALTGFLPVCAADPPVSGRGVDVVTARMVTGTQFNFEKKLRNETGKQQAERLYLSALDFVARDQAVQAQAQLQQALQNYPGHGAARRLLGALLIDAHSFLEAQALLKTGLALTPGDTEQATLLAQAYLHGGETHLAANTLEQYRRAARANPYYSNLLAFSYYRSGDYDKAASVLQELVKAQPAFTRAWITLGLSQESLGKYPLALSAYQQALQSAELAPPVRRFLDSRIERLARIDSSHDQQ